MANEAFGIQRVPRGLMELLNLTGGESPKFLAAELRANIDLLQFYGLQQLNTAQTQNAAAALNASVVVIPSSTNWCLLFQAQGRFAKTATQTALWGSVAWQRNTSILISDLKSSELGPYGATAAGAAVVAFVPEVPKLLPPGSQIIARTTVLGTDATSDVTVRCEFGIF